MKRLCVSLLVIICFSFVLVGCKGSSDDITSIEQLNDSKYTIGATMGEAAVGKIRTCLPCANIQEYRDIFTGCLSVANGNIDAFAYDYEQLAIALEGGIEGVRFLDGYLGESTEIAIGISRKTKIPGLVEKINQFVDYAHENGIIDELYESWVEAGLEEVKPFTPVENPTMHLVIGTSGVVPPYSYYKGSTLTGYDIELAHLLAQYLNASIEIRVYDYVGLISAAQAGTIDCILANLNITPERAEAIWFSKPTMVMNTGVVVRDGSSVASGGFFSSVVSSFEKTFIREDRYLLFLDGIGMTLLISSLSVVFGTVLGFVSYLFCRRGNKVANALSRFLIWLIQGMPMVVLLMVLYYIVFASLHVNGAWVAIIGFSLTFAAAMFSMLKAGVGAVDHGQVEAAYALGFKDGRTFFEVVLPQALMHFMPEYKAQVVALVKATSIVGYIAVQDLTKVADIVRSRTYDAFFSLFSVAVVYFILAGILTFIIGRVILKVDPRKRPRDKVLKEVGR